MRFAGQIFENNNLGGSKPQQSAPTRPVATPPIPGHQSAFGGGLMRPYESQGGVRIAMGHSTQDHVDAVASEGISGNGARSGPRIGGRGGGAPLGIDKLADFYMGDDSDFGPYDPAERVFFPGV